MVNSIKPIGEKQCHQGLGVDVFVFNFFQRTRNQRIKPKPLVHLLMSGSVDDNRPRGLENARKLPHDCIMLLPSLLLAIWQMMQHLIDHDRVHAFPLKWKRFD